MQREDQQIWSGDTAATTSTPPVKVLRLSCSLVISREDPAASWHFESTPPLQVPLGMELSSSAIPDVVTMLVRSERSSTATSRCRQEKAASTRQSEKRVALDICVQ